MKEKRVREMRIKRERGSSIGNKIERELKRKREKEVEVLMIKEGERG